MPYLTADDGEKLYYTDQGKGKTIFFIHGWMASHLEFEGNIAYLSKKFRCVTMDVRGHGFSGRVEKNLSLSQAAKDAYRIMEELDLKDVFLVGHSMGAVICMHYVKQFGNERLKGVCFIDQPPKMINDNKWKYGSVDFEGARQVETMVYTQFEMIASNLASLNYAPDNQPSPERLAVLQDAMEKMMRNMSKHAIIAFWNELCIYDFRRLMTKFPVPLLGCMGYRSMAYPAHPGIWYKENVPKCTIVDFMESGHLVNIDEEEKFNTTIEKFVDSL